MSIYRITCTGMCQGQTMQNVLHFQKPQGTEADKQPLINFVVDRIIGQWRFLQAREMIWHEVMCQHLNNENDVPLIFPILAPGLHNEIKCYALMLTAVLKISTAQGGRSGRGRIYIAVPPANSLESGRWNAQYKGFLGSVCASHKQWFNNTNPQSGFTLGVLPRSAGEGDFKSMVDIVGRDYPGTQVKRNFHRGK